MKPTWGLVPYTGIMPIEIFVDHTGPMTAHVADNALLLEVIAGRRRLRSRGSRRRRCTPYTEALGGGVKGMKIGIVKEGFEQAGAEAAVNEKVARRGEAAGQPGRQVEEVSIPMHMVGAGDLDPDRHRRPHPDHDVRRRLRRSAARISIRRRLMDFHRGWRSAADEMSRDHQAVV